MFERFEQGRSPTGAVFRHPAGVGRVEVGVLVEVEGGGMGTEGGGWSISKEFKHWRRALPESPSQMMGVFGV